MADALATLASMIMVKFCNEVPNLTVMRLDRPTHVFVVEEIKDESRGITTLSVSSNVRFTRLGHL